MIEPAMAALSEMGVADIARFEDLLAEKLHALDTEAHAREIGEDCYQKGKHFSVDWFLYSRCVVVANGSAIFASILSDPAEMPKDCEFEALLTIGPEAYARKTGQELNHQTPLMRKKMDCHGFQASKR